MRLPTKTIRKARRAGRAAVSQRIAREGLAWRRAEGPADCLARARDHGHGWSKPAGGVRFNRDNVKSKDAPLVFHGADTLKRKGTAYIIAVGVNEYANSQYNLKYASADARSFGEEMRRGKRRSAVSSASK
jgi:hypothetical protein